MVNYSCNGALKLLHCKISAQRTRFPCSARGFASLLWMLCSVLDFSEAGPSAAGAWSCIYKDIDRVSDKNRAREMA